ncbi:hypothetical protein [Streptomyces sp. NPDC008001]|uniref:hypothetical protein n=1 Tax=Streptomyces sp. NPDC008001 TaxID=3364804 RepID=UPI0036E1C0EC
MPAVIRADRRWQAESTGVPMLSPSWTRLEPQSCSGDPGPGLAAQLHDPLWTLTRQWQFGEFAGVDAGTPLAVRVDAVAAPVTQWQPGDWTAEAAAPVRELPPDQPLDVLVEREPVHGRPGARARAEAGAALLAALRDAGLDDAADAVLLRNPLPTGDTTDSPEWTDVALALAGHAADAHEVCAALEAEQGETGTGAGSLPDWLRDAIPQGRRDDAQEIIARWLAWYRQEIEPQTDDSSWVGRHLEYRFSVAVHRTDGDHTLRAPEFGGAEVDWWTFDLDTAGSSASSSESAELPAAEVEFTQRCPATPLRFSGMPADRFWEFEDEQVDFGSLESDPHDLARLLVAECALVYGCDWLVLPLDVPARSLVTVRSITYRTTFNETHLAWPPPPGTQRSRCRMFTVSEPEAVGRAVTKAEAGTSRTVEGLLVPPPLLSRIEGPAVEEVAFLRDESANLAWAVERVVENTAGEPRLRESERYDTAVTTDDRPEAELNYLLQTSVPDWWIPYLPTTRGYATSELVRSVLLRFGNDAAGDSEGKGVEPQGRLLKEGGNDVIADAEIPREGLRIRRVPTLARRTDGSYDLWTARRVTVGRGEGRSGLAFDSALPR